MRGREEQRTASQATRMSFSTQRASPAMIGPSTSAATRRTASASPAEAMGNPASMMSTPKRCSLRASTSFSAVFMLQPGACSPSRSEVSKINTRSGSIATSRTH